jgi:hypothetical protein
MLVRIGQCVAANVCGGLGALMGRLVLAKPASHVYAADRIIYAVLDVPGVGHALNLPLRQRRLLRDVPAELQPLSAG